MAWDPGPLEWTVQANVSVQAAPTEHAPFSKAASYAFAVAATGAVALARGALDPWLREQAILLPFVLAVLAAAVAGGLGPGLVATGVAMVVAAVASSHADSWRSQMCRMPCTSQCSPASPS
jgi:K+-sensing histidine kinase KdpD